MATIVSFYTPDPFYIACADRLRQRCKQLGVEHHIVEQNYGPNWIDNVRAKPTFLLAALKRLRRGFFWLDVDCLLLKPPTFTPNKWGVYLRPDGTPHDFVHYVPADSFELLKKWQAMVDSTVKGGSHTAFIVLNPETEVMPPGFFQLGLSATASKLDYFRVR